MSSPSREKIKAKFSEGRPDPETEPGAALKAGEDPARVPYEVEVEQVRHKPWNTMALFERAFLSECFLLKIPAATALEQFDATRAFIAACRELTAAGLELERSKIEVLMAATQAGFPEGFIERGLRTLDG